MVAPSNLRAMNILGAMQLVGVLVLVIGLALLLMGMFPATRARVGDTLGWGVSLVVLGFVMLLILWMLPMAAG